MAFDNYLFLSATIIFIHKSCRKMRRQCFTLIQEKGKKRQTGWFPASYVKLLESKDAKAGNAAAPAAAAAATNAAAAEKFRAVHAFASQGRVHKSSLSVKLIQIRIRDGFCQILSESEFWTNLPKPELDL